MLCITTATEKNLRFSKSGFRENSLNTSSVPPKLPVYAKIEMSRTLLELHGILIFETHVRGISKVFQKREILGGKEDVYAAQMLPSNILKNHLLPRWGCQVTWQRIKDISLLVIQIVMSKWPKSPSDLNLETMISRSLLVSRLPFLKISW